MQMTTMRFADLLRRKGWQAVREETGPDGRPRTVYSGNLASGGLGFPHGTIFLPADNPLGVLRDETLRPLLAHMRLHPREVADYVTGE